MDLTIETLPEGYEEEKGILGFLKGRLQCYVDTNDDCRFEVNIKSCIDVNPYDICTQCDCRCTANCDGCSERNVKVYPESRIEGSIIQHKTLTYSPTWSEVKTSIIPFVYESGMLTFVFAEGWNVFDVNYLKKVFSALEDMVGVTFLFSERSDQIYYVAEQSIQPVIGQYQLEWVAEDIYKVIKSNKGTPIRMNEYRLGMKCLCFNSSLSNGNWKYYNKLNQELDRIATANHCGLLVSATTNFLGNPPDLGIRISNPQTGEVDYYTIGSRVEELIESLKVCESPEAFRAFFEENNTRELTGLSW